MRRLHIAVLTCLSMAACARHRSHVPSTAKPCTTDALLLRSASEAPRAFSRLASASLTCRRDCEERALARACELEADAVILEAPEHTVLRNEPRPSDGRPFNPDTATTVGSRDEHGNPIFTTGQPHLTQRATFLRWKE